MNTAISPPNPPPLSSAKAGQPRMVRAGLQAKLVLSFLGMLAIALGVSGYSFLSLDRATIEATGRRHAIELAHNAATAGAGSLIEGHRWRLGQIAEKLIDDSEVETVSFFGPSGELLVERSDPSLAAQRTALRVDPRRQVGKTQLMALANLGRFWVATVAVPDLRLEPRPAASDVVSIGFVSVGVSQNDADLAMDRTKLRIVLVGTLAVLCCVPIASALIHKLFNPIRRLVGATKQIIAGDLDARVEVNRSDVIGTLAHLFNQMVLRVKSQQEALAAANRELESKVLLRTAQLESANARLSNEIAEKEDFLRAVSHDLNAPLRNIAGMAMMLMRRREQLDADAIHRLERIQKNVEVETDLIGELLELSRIKTRRLKMETVSSRAVVEEVADLFEEELRGRSINLSIEGSLPSLVCERIRLRQVFQNLIDNAIKYMGDQPSGRREIRIGCVSRLDGVEFFVGDTGIGISPEDLPRVFHVFRRGANARSSNIPGKGVGLSSVKSIVETYDGTIWVESEVGKGSTVHFTIHAKYIATAAGTVPIAISNNAA